MLNLTRFESNDGTEFYIETVTGEAFTTQAGYARMSDVEYATVRKRYGRLKGSDNSELKTGEVQTPGGIQEVTLIPADVAYEWLKKDKPELAKQMEKAGATLYFYKEAGYKVTVEAIKRVVNYPTQVEIDDFLANQQELANVERDIKRMEVKLNFINTYDIVKEWKEANVETFRCHDGTLSGDYRTFESQIVNQCYLFVLGAKKMYLSQKLGFSVTPSHNVRNYLPLNALAALHAFEVELKKCIQIFGINPMDAIETAKKMMVNDPRWSNTKFPLDWKGTKAITCPSRYSETDWLAYWYYEKERLEKLIQAHMLMYRENALLTLPVAE